jgi:hypothetical protein
LTTKSLLISELTDDSKQRDTILKNNKSEWAKYFKQSTDVIILHDCDKIFAAVAYTFHDIFINESYINLEEIDASIERKGYGSQIMNRLYTIAKEKKKDIRVYTVSPKGQKFFLEKHKFTVKKYPKKYPDMREYEYLFIRHQDIPKDINIHY